MLVGFDPGKTGGLVAVHEHDGRYHSHLRIPLIGSGTRSRVDGRFVSQWLGAIAALERDGRPPRIAIERVHSMSGEGVVSAFSFGKATGAVLAVAECLSYSIVEVRPQDWQNVMLRGQRRNPKAARKQSCALVASDLHPELAEVLRIKAAWGLADASLIAEYTRRVLIGTVRLPYRT